MAQWLTPSSHFRGTLLSLVGIAERQWSPTLPLMVCVKAFSLAGVLLDAHLMRSWS
ncbi:hypothetical protein L208DRAFT_1392006 [Tricholoma matsutake]|nr:hypothetical protein L208DRAFT_1392006 [Tricholoma matsutake 945]